MGLDHRLPRLLASCHTVFLIGFPITLAIGLLGMLLTLPLMNASFTMALERLLTHFQ